MNSVSSDGIANKFPNLTVLNLTGTKITTASGEEIAKLNNLFYIDYRRTGINSGEGIKRSP